MAWLGRKKKQNEVKSKNNVQSVADGTFGMSFSITYNVMQICEGKDLETKILTFKTKYNYEK